MILALKPQPRTFCDPPSRRGLWAKELKNVKCCVKPLEEALAATAFKVLPELQVKPRYKHRIRGSKGQPMRYDNTVAPIVFGSRLVAPYINLLNAANAQNSSNDQMEDNAQNSANDQTNRNNNNRTLRHPNEALTTASDAWSDAGTSQFSTEVLGQFQSYMEVEGLIENSLDTEDQNWLMGGQKDEESDEIKLTENFRPKNDDDKHYPPGFKFYYYMKRSFMFMDLQAEIAPLEAKINEIKTAIAEASRPDVHYNLNRLQIQYHYSPNGSMVETRQTAVNNLLQVLNCRRRYAWKSLGNIGRQMQESYASYKILREMCSPPPYFKSKPYDNFRVVRPDYHPIKDESEMFWVEKRMNLRKEQWPAMSNGKTVEQVLEDYAKQKELSIGQNPAYAPIQSVAPVLAVGHIPTSAHMLVGDSNPAVGQHFKTGSLSLSSRTVLPQAHKKRWISSEEEWQFRGWDTVVRTGTMTMDGIETEIYVCKVCRDEKATVDFICNDKSMMTFHLKGHSLKDYYKRIRENNTSDRIRKLSELSPTEAIEITKRMRELREITMEKLEFDVGLRHLVEVDDDDNIHQITLEDDNQESENVNQEVLEVIIEE